MSEEYVKKDILDSLIHDYIKENFQAAFDVAWDERVKREAFEAQQNHIGYYWRGDAEPIPGNTTVMPDGKIFQWTWSDEHDREVWIQIVGALEQKWTEKQADGYQAVV